MVREVALSKGHDAATTTARVGGATDCATSDQPEAPRSHRVSPPGTGPPQSSYSARACPRCPLGHAREWGPHRLSGKEFAAIQRAEKQGEYWLARLLEREAQGRFVHQRVSDQFQGLLRFNHKGVDVVDPATGRKYEILSGTASNLARHGRRMSGEFFRMLTF